MINKRETQEGQQAGGALLFNPSERDPLSDPALNGKIRMNGCDGMMPKPLTREAGRKMSVPAPSSGSEVLYAVRDEVKLMLLRLQVSVLFPCPGL